MKSVFDYDYEHDMSDVVIRNRARNRNRNRQKLKLRSSRPPLASFLQKNVYDDWLIGYYLPNPIAILIEILIQLDSDGDRDPKKKPSIMMCIMMPGKICAGDDLLSHEVALAVPWALTVLTSVFGMGTGVALSLKTPAKNF